MSRFNGSFTICKLHDYLSRVLQPARFFGVRIYFNQQKPRRLKPADRVGKHLALAQN